MNKKLSIKLSTLNSQFSTNVGFALSEALFIFGILSVTTILLVKIFDPYDKYLAYQDNIRKDDLAHIQEIAEQHKVKFGKYPRSINHKIMGVEWGGKWEAQGIILPKDPLFPDSWYIYETDPDESMYWAYASLARGGKDKSVCKNTLDESTRCDNVPRDKKGKYIKCGSKGEICNYGLSSENSSP